MIFLVIFCAFFLIGQSASDTPGLGVMDGWDGKIPIVMPKTMKARYEGQSHTCDEWCTLGLCCECQSSNYENKPARPKYKFPGPFDGRPGKSGGDEVCRCNGAPDIDHSTCFNPFSKSTVTATYDTFLEICCTYSETFHDYKKEMEEKFKMHKRLNDAIDQKEDKFLPDGKHKGDVDPDSSISASCHILNVEGFKCFERSVYVDAKLTFERGRTLGATWEIFTNHCCQKPTCGNLRAANPNKYSCKMLDQKFRFKPENSADLPTSSNGWFLNCCTCNHSSCGTCDALASKMQCIGTVFNVAMKGKSLACLPDDFQRVCCVESSSSATGIIHKHCWGNENPDVLDRRLAATINSTSYPRLSFTFLFLFSLFMFHLLSKCYKAWTTQAGDTIELLLDHNDL